MIKPFSICLLGIHQNISGTSVSTSIDFYQPISKKRRVTFIDWKSVVSHLIQLGIFKIKFILFSSKMGEKYQEKVNKQKKKCHLRI